MTAARETVLDADKPAAPVFCVLHGGCAGAHLALPAAAATVGRALDNDIVLDAAGVAERHLTLRLTAGVVTATATALVITLAGGSTGAIDLGMDRSGSALACAL